MASVGGTIITEASEVFASNPEHVKSRWNLSTILLVLAAVWFVWDIAVRRFHLDLSKAVPVDAIKRKNAEQKSKAEEKRLLKAEKKAIKNAEKESKKASAVNAALKAGAMMEQQNITKSVPDRTPVETMKPVLQQPNRKPTVRVWTKGGGEITQQKKVTTERPAVPQIGKSKTTPVQQTGKDKKELLNTRALLKGLDEEE